MHHIPSLRVVVADDHPVFRDGLAMILRERGMDVVAEVADGHGALETAVACHPDVVLMDLTMPGLGGIEATRRMSQTGPTMPPKSVRPVAASQANATRTASTLTTPTQRTTRRSRSASHAVPA